MTEKQDLAENLYYDILKLFKRHSVGTFTAMAVLLSLLNSTVKSTLDLCEAKHNELNEEEKAYVERMKILQEAMKNLTPSTP